MITKSTTYFCPTCGSQIFSFHVLMHKEGGVQVPDRDGTFGCCVNCRKSIPMRDLVCEREPDDTDDSRSAQEEAILKLTTFSSFEDLNDVVEQDPQNLHGYLGGIRDAIIAIREVI